MDAATLRDCTQNRISLAQAQAMLPEANEALIKANANTVRRVAAYFSQVVEESAGLIYTEEIGQGHGHSYAPYCGRTFIQITWDYNYRAFGHWCHQHGLVGDPDAFVHSPSSLAAPKWAWLGPSWYLTMSRPAFMTHADAGDIYQCTRDVNGGLNGIQTRLSIWNHCLALGERILPTPPVPEGLFVTPADHKTLADMEARLTAQINAVAGEVWNAKLGDKHWRASSWLQGARDRAAAAATAAAAKRP